MATIREDRDRCHANDSDRPGARTRVNPAAVDARECYERGKTAFAGKVEALERRSRAIGSARLALAAAGVALLGGIVWRRLGAGAWVALALVAAAFLALVVVHSRVFAAKERASAALRFHERGLRRLAHAWGELPSTSERFRGGGEHPFAGDLDIFGRASLMQLVDSTETPIGEARLAELLARQDFAGWPEGLLERQRAVRELAGRFAFREALATAGGVLAEDGGGSDVSTLLAWAEQSGPARDPKIPPALHAAAWVLPALAASAVAFGPAVHLEPGAVTLVVATEILLGIAAGERLTRMLAAASARESAVTRWQEMIAAMEGEPFEAPLLARLRNRLLTAAPATRSASAEVAALARIVGFLDARRNEVFRFFLGPFVFWDVHWGLALERWRARAGGRLRGWLDAIAEIEAFAAFGSFAFEHPDFAFPEPAAEPLFQAQALAHPLLLAQVRVGNDLDLPEAARALVVTGSNMSGKSTLLRAIGINAVLALAGAPACAHRLRIGPLRVATSMRVQDSLEQGVSHFYAELRRLKQVLDLAHESPPVLFLLDEILHGTNSRERVLGARAVVRELLGAGALGAVSTHDLGIVALEEELGGRVVNVHFEEQVSGDVLRFDYALRPGVVRSSNALRLMRALGIRVDET
jgi:hypothetical protein